MKKRRIVFLSFMLAAALTIGVGYAALSDQLTVTGSASVDASDFEEVFDIDVYFSKAVSTPELVTASIDATDKDEAIMTVLSGLDEVGDEVIATYTIKSDSDLTVNVTPSVMNATGDAAYTDEYFAVTLSKTGVQTIEPNGSMDITVTVKLIKTPVTGVKSTSFKVLFDALPA